MTGVLCFFAFLLASCGESRYEEGCHAGYESAEEEIRQPAYEEGYTEGHEEGYAEGLDEGSCVETDEIEPDAKGNTAIDYESYSFVLVADEVPDAILEMRYYSTFNFVGDRINGYEAPVAYLTKETASTSAGIVGVSPLAGLISDTSFSKTKGKCGSFYD